jgi:hypothetical protein
MTARMGCERGQKRGIADKFICVDLNKHLSSTWVLSTLEWATARWPTRDEKRAERVRRLSILTIELLTEKLLYGCNNAMR